MATRQLQHHSQLLHSVVFHFLLLNVYMSAFVAISTNAAGTRKSFSSHFSPNFEQEYPHFTPFNAPDFIHADSESVVGDHADYNADSSVFVPVAAQQPTPVAAAPPFVSSHKLFSSSVSQKRIVQPKRQQLSDIVDAVDADDIKPFKSFVLDLYKNYRSAYMNGNQTIGGMLGVSPAEIEDVVMDEQHHEDEEPIVDEVLVVTDAPNKVRRKFKPKHQRKPSASQMPQPNQIFDDDEVKYNVGPGVNISVEPNKELVNVYLDEDCLKDVFTGRGRKHDLISKILPLFILPFLIQSAIVPFAVTTLKLLLVKSILVGKIAIFLLIVSALKNHHNKYSSYDSPPQYVVDPPSRRSEAVGYRVEGKPTTWVN